jgi:hypothetical protein
VLVSEEFDALNILKDCLIFWFTVIAETGVFALSTILFDEIFSILCS